ncbi:hypothetical protein ILUMI_12355 [Ignelater luminosus]|uniref:Uncharacterized protein n=1 Tax=Ignelater luminosus TaxID=2038154 RepID=A0A8K0GD12_IGNLU|nr:hypothetical protein ILUMI_12355 [Ignelater luminosus]
MADTSELGVVDIDYKKYHLPIHTYYCRPQTLHILLFMPLCIFTENLLEVNQPPAVDVKEMATSHTISTTKSTPINSPSRNSTPVKRSYPFKESSSVVKPQVQRNTLLSSLQQQKDSHKEDNNKIHKILTQINDNLSELVAIKKLKLQLKYPNLIVTRK